MMGANEFKEESVLNDTGLSELDRRIEKALAMGGPEKLGRRRASGLLNARERIDYFVDKGSYIETGMFGVDRKSVGEGKSVSVRVGTGGRRIINTNKEINKQQDA